jgi:hypothetical protein
MLLFAVLAGCSSGDNSLSADDAPAPPTHSLEVVGEALTIGRLGGDSSCLWLGENETTATGLVFPSGTEFRATADSGTEVALADSWSARVGDRVALTGEWSSEYSACNGSQEPAFVVGFVEVCPSPSCE